MSVSDFSTCGLDDVVVNREPSMPSLVKSAARVLQIFDFFDEVQRPAKVHEIAERLNFPQSSTSVLLKSLIELGFMDYDADARTFLPSPRIALLGGWVGGGPMRDGSIIRMMEELAGRTGEAIVLATRNGPYAQDVRVIQGRGPDALSVPQGLRRLAVWSGAGLALLKDESNELVQALCRRANAEATDGAVIDYQRVKSGLEHLRRSGYYFSKGLVTPGVGSLAMPLPAGLDQPSRSFAIAIAGRLRDMEPREKQLAAILRQTVTEYLTPYTNAR
jgi:DNA-binding IclR family transcriptional regulator